MAVTGHVFPQFMIGMGLGDITLPGGTWKIALGNAAGPITLATSGISTAKTFSDWTAIVSEIVGTGYTAGGVTVASPTFTAGGTSNAVATFTTSTTPTWTGASFSANQAVLYQSSASTYQLLGFFDFGGAISPSAENFQLNINASGLLTATAS
jgi:Na+/phosphate symporter